MSSNFDAIKLREIRKTNITAEEQLKELDINLNDIPENCEVLLDEYVKIKKITDLHSLEPSYLEEYIYLQKKKQLDNRVIIYKIKSDIEDYNQELNSDRDQIKFLEKLLKSVSIKSEADIEKGRLQLERNNEDLMKMKQKASSNCPDYNLDELLQKIHQLESMESNKKENRNNTKRESK